MKKSALRSPLRLYPLAILIAGRIGELIIVLILMGLSMLSLVKALRGKPPTLRKLAAIDALEEVVGRASETGRPVLFTPGFGGGYLRGDYAYSTLAGMSIMTYTARLSVRLGAKFMSMFAMPDAIPLARALIQEGLRMEGRPEEWKEEMVQFASPMQFAYSNEVIATMSRDKVGGVVFVGPYWAEALIFAEVSNTVGAMSVAGTDQYAQLPFFVGVCDYTLIGEEMYAAGAYLSNDPVQLGSLEGEDWSRILMIVLMVGGIAFTSALTALLKL